MSDEHVIAEFLRQAEESRKSGTRPANADTLVAQLIGMVGGHSPLKPRAIEALSKTDWPLAINFLSALTPAGMVFIPAGEFSMGSAENENEQPPHHVWVDSIYMDRAPVTNKQFGEFWEEVPYTTYSTAWVGFDHAREQIHKTQLRHAPYNWFDPDWNQPDRPVVGVTWYEAVVYARWAGKRLPTEAEWEKAARGADARRYPWGNDFDPARCNTNLAENATNATTPPGQFSPRGDSPYGVQDMAGNVWQWTSSALMPYPYCADGREDLQREGKRVLRGGGFRSRFEDHYRSAYRYAQNPDYIYVSVGFRCAATVPPLMRA